MAEWNTKQASCLSVYEAPSGLWKALIGALYPPQACDRLQYLQIKFEVYPCCMPCHWTAKISQKAPLQDLDGLILFARKRAVDKKGSVRKSGMLLLEALLLICVRGLGGAAPQLPAIGDLEAIEAATLDPLVRLICSQPMYT